MLSVLPDAIVTTAGTPVTINVLANDTGNDLKITSFTNPANGSVTFNSDKTFTYTPAQGFVGADGFTYTVRDAHGTPASGEVAITVVEGPGATVASDDVAEVVAGGAVTIPVLANDMAADGGALQIIAVGMPGHGVANVLPDQTIRYVPQSGFTGIDSFTYTVIDGQGNTASATVAVTVVTKNSAPLAVDDTFTIEAGQSKLLAVLANDSDPDGGPLQVVGFTMPSHGSLVFNANRTFTYTPAEGYLGNDQFTYTIRDARGASASASVTLVVVQLDEAPIAQDDHVATEAGMPVTIDVLANDVLPEGQQINIVAVTLPYRGHLAFNPGKTITYTPNQGFVGTDDFTYTISNGKGGTAKAKVTIEVTAAVVDETYANGYGYRRRLAIPASSAKGGSHTNFPLWAELSGAWLRSTANGGKVASSDGHDLRFELTDGTKLAHEVEHYDAQAGKLGAWVRLPELRSDQPTVVLVYYGKPGLAASEAEPVAVWQDYLAVWHLPTTSDRSGNGRDLVVQGDVQASPLGLGFGSALFNGNAVLKIDDVSWLNDLDALSVQVRSKANSTGHNHGQLNAGAFGTDGASDLVIRYQAIGFATAQPTNILHSKLATNGQTVFVSSNTGTQTAEWQSITFAWQGGDSSPTLHLDGHEADASFVSTANNATRTAINGPLVVGAGPRDTIEGGWVGLIDKLRFRAEKLDPAWIEAEHINHSNPARFFGTSAEESFTDGAESLVAVPLEATTPVGKWLDLDVLAAALLPAGSGVATIQSVTQPANGSASAIGGKVRYSPASGFSGTDSFTYQLVANGKSSKALITVVVGAKVSEGQSDLYSSIVNDIPDLLAYWRCTSTDQLTDAVGARHGIFNATPSSVPAIAPDSRGSALKFNGQRATVPHDAGLLLPAFTLSFWLRLDAGVDGSINRFIIAKDAAGLNNGDFALGLTVDEELWARFQTTAGSAPGVTHPTTVGVPLHVATVGSAAGLALWVDGKLIGVDDSYTGGWSSNTAAIRFANPEFSQLFADVTLDEVALYSRVLTEGEILALARKLNGTVPIAPDHGPFELTGGSKLEIDLLNDAAYVGSSPIVAIVDKGAVTGAGHGVTVMGGIATFASTSVEDDTEGLTFTYTIKDANGTSEPGTVTVNIRETVAPNGGPIYQCYAENNADTVEVSTMDALVAACNGAPPGRNILIAPGNYTGGTRTFDPRGKAGNPVVIRPRDGIGTVTINSPAWTFQGSRFVLSGIYFNNSRITFDSGTTYNRITRCRFRQVSRDAIVLRAARWTRVDHCDFADYLSTEAQKGFVRLIHSNVGNGTLKHVLIDRCYVHDVDPSIGVGFMEPFGLTASTSGAAAADCDFTIRDNLFARLNLKDEGELIGAKASNIFFYRNTIIDCGSNLYLNAPRQAAKFRMIENWFENLANSNPIRLFSKNSEAIGNRLIGGISMNVCPGDFYWAGSNQAGYAAADACRIVGNQLGSGRIRIGTFTASQAPRPARNNNLWANTRDSGGNAHVFNSGFHTGTTFNVDSVPFTPAVKLTPSDVGLLAPDPGCGV